MAEKKSLKRQSSMSEDFSVFLHDPKNGTYCGTRTKEAWGKILGFYLIYYICISAFWAICFAGMMANVPDKSDGPLTQRGSGQSDVYAYAHIRTGNPQLFPISAYGAHDPIEKDDRESIVFTAASRHGAAAQIDKFFDDEYSEACAASAKAAFKDVCGDHYGFGNETKEVGHSLGGAPCFFIKMANVWGFPQEKYQGAIRCHMRQKNATGDNNRIDVDITSFNFIENPVSCTATPIAISPENDESLANGQYGYFQTIPFRGPKPATPLQPVVAIRLASRREYQGNWQQGVEATVFCDMPDVDQGQLVGGEPEVRITVSI